MCNCKKKPKKKEIASQNKASQLYRNIPEALWLTLEKRIRDIEEQNTKDVQELLNFKD